MKTLKIILLSFCLILFSGCSFDSEYQYEEEVLSYKEFIEITNKGFDSIEIDEHLCYSFEYYDSSTDECILDVYCFEELGECERIDEIYASFEEYLEQQDYYSNSDFHYHSLSEDEDLYNEFYITESDELEATLGEWDIQTQQIWEEFSNLIPKEYRTNLRYYGTFTDGVEETLAYVSQRNTEDPEIWYLAIDYQDHDITSKSDFTHTYIHEFAHILSFHEQEIDYYTHENCQTFQLIEGCLKDNSYMFSFYSSFWEGTLQSRFEELSNEYGEEDAGYYLYEEFGSNEFISDYAATNVVEDFAESFTYYVLSSNSNIEQSSSKIQFFNQFEELKTLRLEIRKNLDKSTRKYKK